ncbi:MAG: hypothetical protein J6X48_05535 [Lachnospiraceae bacterium]|nr:hypothetical protein [Lachnospiraceae bacterium]
MIRICVKKPLYSYERVVFPNSIIESKADIIRYMRYTVGDVEGLKYEEKDETLINDLTLSEDELFMLYDKKVRNEIRRAEKEDISFYFYNAKEVAINAGKEEVIDKYYDFCDGINKPELKNNLNRDEFKAFVANGNIAISKAEYGDGGVYHIYMYDDKTAMLWFSFSDYRNLEGKNQVAGWANRALHHKDMMAFKELGLEKYEWGGISSSKEPNGIDKFKMNFGGTVTNVYYDFKGNTLKGKILIGLKSLISKRKEE